MTTDGNSGLNVAAELAEMRGEMLAGFTRLEGQLALISQKQDSTAKDLDERESRVAALEARRVPWPMVAAVSGAVSAVGAVVGYLAQ
ncbi:hypothetical protein [Streptomyces phage phiSAJS1]|uniref:hypothetical protein n=1 Tax=Streptomyces phage phiSAJS1 TaxID=1755682 RepID=UPI000E300D6E|nr:hypothetical protein AVT91_p36 [Streptomyces phage phiSAJS1]AXP07821.1 hypothetical protein [Streptomyces phage phiSAJS1]